MTDDEKPTESQPDERAESVYLADFQERKRLIQIQRRAARAQRAERIRTRQVQSFSLKLAGASFRDIAKATGVSLRQAKQDVDREKARLAALDDIPAAERRWYQAARHEWVYRKMAVGVSRGDSKCAREATESLKEISRLYGLHAPTKSMVVQRVDLDANFSVRQDWSAQADELSRLSTDELKLLDHITSLRLVGDISDVEAERMWNSRRETAKIEPARHAIPAEVVEQPTETSDTTITPDTD